MKRRLIFCLALAAACLLLAASIVAQAAPASQPSAKAAMKSAGAVLEAKSGSKLTGKAVFTEEAGGKIMLKVEIEGIAPGTHAVHIHEKGDCSAADGASAGGHWNPTAEAHGKWGTSPYHRGDIGNIEVGADGKGSITLTTDAWAIGAGTPNDIIGKAIIVHANADDFKTQPTGNAGGRIGCGVIK